MSLSEDFLKLYGAVLFAIYLLSTREQRERLNAMVVGVHLPRAHMAVASSFYGAADAFLKIFSWFAATDLKGAKVSEVLRGVHWRRVLQASTIFGVSAVVAVDIARYFLSKTHFHYTYRAAAETVQDLIVLGAIVCIIGVIIRTKFVLRKMPAVLVLTCFVFLIFFIFPWVFLETCRFIMPPWQTGWGTCMFETENVHSDREIYRIEHYYAFGSVMKSVISERVIYSDLCILATLVFAARLRVFYVGLILAVAAVNLSIFKGFTNLDFDNFFSLTDTIRNQASRNRLGSSELAKLYDILPWMVLNTSILLNGIANFIQDGASIAVSIYLFQKLRFERFAARFFRLITIDAFLALALALLNLSLLVFSIFALDRILLLSGFGDFLFRAGGTYFASFWDQVMQFFARVWAGEAFGEYWFHREKYTILVLGFSFSTLIPSIIFAAALFFKLFMAGLSLSMIQIWKTLKEERGEDTFSKTLHSYHVLMIYIAFIISVGLWAIVG